MSDKEIASRDIRWHLVQVVSGKEKEVRQDFQEKLSSEEGKDCDVQELFVPTEFQWRVQRGVKVQKEICLYPGYLFVYGRRTPLVESLLRSVKGVLSFIGDSDAISAEDIERMRLKATPLSEVPEDAELIEDYHVGDEVQVIEGCFASMVGMVRAVSGDKVSVSVNIFDKTTFLELAFSSVRKVGI